MKLEMDHKQTALEVARVASANAARLAVQKAADNPGWTSIQVLLAMLEFTPLAPLKWLLGIGRLGPWSSKLHQ